MASTGTVRAVRVAWEEFVRTAELDHLDVGRRLTRHGWVLARWDDTQSIGEDG